ncbi:fibronectin type III domain-containing protein [Flavobacterium sp. '19STA2R22 D10 B1']|uniref:fibronectin type III domain-containing protein n=1 Tax=Flavobacterium aerium TaxID=3037261 RepID=UPI00278C13BD|nr:fibronectin type III domain-containing protein [Flavobacterium sp. '19STA2R22 D10 B1']
MKKITIIGAYGLARDENPTQQRSVLDIGLKDHWLNSLGSRLSVLLMPLLFILFSTSATAQVSYTQNWTATGDAGWIGGTRSTDLACQTGSYRANPYSGATTKSLVSPSVGTSNGGLVTMNFDYKIVNYASPYAGTPTTFGTLKVEYSTSASGPWTTASTIDATSHVPATTCATKTVTFSAVPGNLFVRFYVTWNAGDYWTIFDNIAITQGAAPSCVSPIGLPFTNVLDVSATGSWTAPATAPANGYEYELRTTGAAGSGATGLVATGTVAATTFNFTALLPTTTYVLYIRSLCGAGESSAWGNVGTFMTTCTIQIAPTAVENFSTYGTTAPDPACWSEGTGLLGTTALTLTGTTSGWAGANYNNLAATNPNGKAAYIELYSTRNDWVISPSINLGNGSTEFRAEFDASVIPYSGSTALTSMAEKFVKVVVSTDNGATWSAANVISTYDNTNIPAGGRSEKISLAGYTGVVKIGFYAYSSDFNTDFRFYIDNFKVEIAPPCVEPSLLAVSNITDATANISWASTGTLFDIEYGLTGFVQGAGALIEGVTNNFLLEGLLGDTAYSYYVRRDCGINGKSAWSGPFAFRTVCSTVTEFTEGFDTVATSTFPSCWGKVGSSGTAYLDASSFFTGPNALYMYSSSATNRAVVKMRPVSNAGAGTHRLRFKLRSSSSFSVNGVVEVGYLTNPNDASTFVMVGSFPAPTTTYEEKIIELGTTPGANTTLAFRHSGSPSNAVYIDDVIWQVKPACSEPQSLTASAITNNSAKLTWISTGTLFDVEYGAPGFAQGSGTMLTGVTNDYVLSPLTGQTAYSYYVRQDCGTTLGKSTWSGPYNFTTTCDPISTLPWTEGFEGLTSVGSDSFPPCWKKENGDWATSDETSYNTPRTGTKYLRNSWSATNEFMHTPGFQLEAGVSYDFSFFTQGDGYTGWVVDVFRNNSQLGTGGTQLGGSFTAPGTGPISIQAYKEVKRTFVPTTSGIYYFSVRVNQPSSSPWYIAFDDFKLVVTPTCPVPTTLVAANVTSSQATLSWVGIGTNYTVEYGPVGFTPGTGTIVTNAVAPLTISQLNSSTVYSFIVKEVCSATDSSLNSDPVNFTTLCGPELAPTVVQTFASYTGYAPNPLCWSESKGALGTTPAAITTVDGKWSNGAYGNVTSGSNSARINLYGTSSDWLISNQIDLGDGTIPFQLKYDAALTMYSGTTSPASGFSTHVVKVVISTDGGATWADANTIKTYNNTSTVTNTGQTEVIALAGYTGIVKVGFFAKTSSTSPDVYFYVDNFVVEKVITCFPPTAITVSQITTEGASVSWTPSGTETQWQYVVQPVGTGTPTTPGTITSTPSATIANLVPGTEYEIVISAICSDNNTSDWSAPTTFNTLRLGSLCENAIPVSGSDLPYTTTDNTSNYGDNYEGVAGVSCGVSTNYLNGNDVVYAYTAVGDGTINIGLNPTQSNVGVFVYTACNLIGNTCVAGAVNNAVGGPININGFNVEAGQTFYIVISTLAPPQSTAYTLTITGTLGTETFNNKNFSYYPNPVKDVLNLSYSENITSVAVFNLMGQQVIQKTVNANQSQIDMSALAAGAYLVRVNSGDNTKTVKVIKQQ